MYVIFAIVLCILFYFIVINDFWGGFFHYAIHAICHGGPSQSRVLLFFSSFSSSSMYLYPWKGERPFGGHLLVLLSHGQIKAEWHYKSNYWFYLLLGITIAKRKNKNKVVKGLCFGNEGSGAYGALFFECCGTVYLVMVFSFFLSFWCSYFLAFPINSSSTWVRLRITIRNGKETSTLKKVYIYISELLFTTFWSSLCIHISSLSHTCIHTHSHS